jgi:hypothetical protein
MKIVEFIRGGSPFPYTGKRDTFDSLCIVIDNSTNTEVFNSTLANTTFANGYKGGILKNGVYGYICDYRQDNGKKVLHICNKDCLPNITHSTDLTNGNRTLPSLIPNPNHDNQCIISATLVHGDGLEGGYSQGCLTIHPNNWQKFIDKFEIGEKGLLFLQTAEVWRV